MEAAGIEPASRDVSTVASTCVVDCLSFAQLAVNRQTECQTSRKPNLTASVPDMTRGDPNLTTDFQVSSDKTLNPGNVLLRGQCKVFVCN